MLSWIVGHMADSVVEEALPDMVHNVDVSNDPKSIRLPSGESLYKAYVLWATLRCRRA